MNLIWDLDGTLIDSMPVIAQCLNKTARQYEQPEWPEEKIRAMIGPELGEVLATLLSLRTEHEIQQAKQTYRAFYQQDMYSSPLFSGILEALKQFSDIGFTHYIATAKYQNYAQEIMASTPAQGMFTSIYGSTKDGRLGNKKDLLAYIIEQEQLKAAQTIMIGDTRFDIEAGRHHNFTSVGVLWGYSDQQALEQAGAHYCVDEPGCLVSEIGKALACGC